MSYRYLALILDHDEPRGCTPPHGLLPRNPGPGSDIDFPAVRLYASESTPAFRLPDGGWLIGHVFDSSGMPLTDSARFQHLASARQIRQHLLNKCWGEYIVIQPAPEQQSVTVMHSPSAACGLPCIYSCLGGVGFVASDVALAIHFDLYRRRIDWDYIAQFLSYPHLRTERTALAGISELLPGVLAGFSQAGVSTETIWNPWDFVTTANRHTAFGEAVSAVRDAITAAVRAFADADESLILELSGGLDSSIVGTCLRDSSANIACSTLVTPVPGADERQYASLVAGALGVELGAVELDIASIPLSFADPADPVRPSVGPLQYAIDTAMGTAGDDFQVNSAFSGGGGDTVFGYLRTAAPAVDAFKERGTLAGLHATRDLATLHQCTVWRALGLSLRKLLRKPRPPFQTDMSFLMPSKTGGTPLDHPWLHAPDDALPGDRERIFELAGNQIFMDYVPRRSRRFFRMPLLSQPVVEACLRTPSWMWISAGQNRAVARAAFADRLPPDILTRRSKGSFMSYLGEVYQHHRKPMLEFLLSGHLHSHGMLDTDALTSFVHASLPARDRSFTRVLDLCRVENWIRQQR